MSLTASFINYFVDLWHTSPLLCIVTILLSLFVTSIIWTQIDQYVNQDSTQPPTVWYWIPFIGSMIEFGIQPLTFMRKNRAKYGDYFTFLMFGRRMTVCLGTDGNYFVFNARHSFVNAEDAYNHLTKPVFGADVIYDVPNHVLMEQKKMGKAALTIENFKRYVPMIVEEVNMYVEENWKKDTDSIDILKAVSEMVIMTASRTILGPEVRAQLYTGVADLYHTLDASFTPIHFLFEWLPLPSYYSSKTAHEKLEEVFGGIIEQRKKQGDKKYNDMLNVFMSYVYKNGEHLTNVQITNMMIAILMAGQHTSSAAITWSLFNLANKHNLVDEAYSQMQQVMGDSLPYPEYDDLKKFSILENTIRETLRIRSPIIQILRKVTRPVSIPGTDYVIPAGNYLVASPTISQTDPKYFPNPEDYNPYRWDSSDANDVEDQDDESSTIDYGFGAMNSKSARSPYLPFGAGRHRCIGEQFAYLQITTILYTLLKQFDFHLDEARGLPEPDYNSMVILPQAPCLLKYTRRSKSAAPASTN
ncbi:hypothetical protein BB560_004566 [Smittium megazygosporum]|uniref:Lanosterol 14-alpha demethylase n=1 Tax=Smittium megazygosporum TaxID=133381 RepID=A0A2T9Z8W7_9FUNG|nr:hypothetical protein BB560_004566 [Smittium megazygosporum]